MRSHRPPKRTDAPRARRGAGLTKRCPLLIGQTENKPAAAPDQPRISMPWHADSIWRRVKTTRELIDAFEWVALQERRAR